METINEIAQVVVNGSAESTGVMSKPVGVRLSIATYKKLMAICDKYEKLPGSLCRSVLEVAIDELYSEVEKIGGPMDAGVTLDELKGLETIGDKL